MRRLAAATGIACILAMTLAIASVAPAAATESSDITTNVTVGAGHTLGQNDWGFTDGCETGVSGNQEMRCAFEFNLPGAFNSSKLLSATLKIARTNGCVANDCAVHLYSYTGNGSADLGDVAQGSEIASWTPNSSAWHQFNVLGQIQTHITNGEYWAGFGLRWVSGDSATQDFDISGATRVTLSVTYIYQPVDINVFLAATEVGAAGKVTSTPAGIDCGTTCTMTIEYASPFKLTAVPLNAQTFFVGWQGITCDEGQNSLTCSFIVPSIPPNIQATFTAAAVTAPPPTPPATSGTPQTPGPSGHATPTPSKGPGATSQPGHTSAPGASSAPAASAEPGASTELGSSGPDATATLAPLETPHDSQNASGQGGVPIFLIVLVAVLAVAVGGGAWYAAKRGQGASPPGG
jgi:hypothetical protein